MMRAMPLPKKVIVDRGLKDGVEQGQPVIDDLGVVGQVTRFFHSRLK
jgi:rod shape-determining protein MreC